MNKQALNRRLSTSLPQRKSTLHRGAALLSSLLLICLLAACSTAPTQPQWLDQPAASYPENRYLSASGQGNSRDKADDRALANLAKIFEVAVADSSLDFSEASVSTTGAISTKQQASRFVTTEARQVLEGAQVVEHWQAEDGTHHSLAVLEKAPAARRFSGSIQAADMQTADLMAYAANEAPNPVVALGALEQARQIQQQRDNTNRNLAVVRGSGIPGTHSEADIEATIRRGLASLEFGAQAPTPELLGAVQAAIASLGIQYRQDSSWQVWGALDALPVQEKQGWYWLRGSMQLSLRHRDDVVANQRWPIKVSATDEGMAHQRARDQLSNELGGKLYQLLVTHEDRPR